LPEGKINSSRAILARMGPDGEASRQNAAPTCIRGVATGSSRAILARMGPAGEASRQNAAPTCIRALPAATIRAIVCTDEATFTNLKSELMTARATPESWNLRPALSVLNT